MKRIKNPEKTLYRNISKKERSYFIILNFACYLLIFCIFVFATVIIINRVIMKTAQDNITFAINAIDDRQTKDGNIDNRIINEVNKRMTIELYNEDGTLTANIGVFGIESGTELKKNEFQMIEAEYYAAGDPSSPQAHKKVFLLAYEIDVDWIYISRGPGGNTSNNIKSVTFYMDVSDELLIRERVTNIFIISVVIILVLAFVATFFASRLAMMPISEALQKQVDFVSDASHELRTPLAIVQSKLENVLSHSDSTILEMSDDLVVTLNEVIRLSKLTNNLLTLSRSDREKIELELVETDITTLVMTTAEPFVEIASLNNKVIDFDCEHFVGFIDKDKVSQILVIFLDNALRYTDEGDKITICLKKVKDEMILSVKDTGIGISEETRLHMFDRFYREDKARNRDTGGRGLGLAIAKALVNVLNGKISADHNSPKGTIVSVSIPLAKKKNL